MRDGQLNGLFGDRIAAADDWLSFLMLVVLATHGLFF